MVPVDSEAGASPHLATVVAVMNRSPHERRARRHALTTTALPLAVAVLTACAPAGEPSGVEAPDSIPTPFSNEEEAFRAAEATYRAYVDALNQVDLADPATFEHVYEFASGDTLATVQEEFTRMHARRWEVAGETIVRVVEPLKISEPARIVLAVCADVSGVTLMDPRGRSRVSSDRPDVHSLGVVVTKNRNGGWSVSEITGRSGKPKCAS